MRIFLKLILSLCLIAFGSVGGFFAATQYRSQLEALSSQVADVAANVTPERKILFYRNPMGLPDTSPVPKLDSMGMDYIAVYEDEDTGPADPSIVKISVEKVQRAGVRTEVVEMRVLSEPLRVPGTVALDERLERSITIRTEGFIEKVYAGATGQHVKAGDPLFRIYSPQIVQAAVEYRIAAAGGQKTIGVKKLRNYGVPESYIKNIPPNGDIPLSLDWPSPVDGVLMSKNIVVGARVMPGDELYRLADVTNVWVIADVPEQDVGRVTIGNPVTIAVRAYPGETFLGKVAFVLPELKKETRTAQVRIELPNPNHRLLHSMYADVTIDTGSTAAVIAIPEAAVIDSGNKQVAIIEVSEGRFKPQSVKLGRRGGGQVEVLEGLAVGEKIVTRANFLIDAESNLQAAFTALVANKGAAQ